MTARISPARASVVAAVGSLLFLAALPSQAHERPQWPGLGCDEALTVAAPFTETPPVLDGVLGEGEWDGAAQLTGFRRLYPDRGVEVALPTVVHVLAGDGHLYVAFDCEIAGASKVRATETREDARLSDQDRVEVIIDSLHDHRRAIELQTSPAGVKSDRRWGNYEWDGIWDVAAQVNETNYIVEIDIDLGSLTYEKGNDGTVGINFTRRSVDPYEGSAWGVDDTGGDDDPHCFAHITGLSFPQNPARAPIRVDAYTVITGDFSDTGDGVDVDAGLDIEYPITPSVTSRFTVLPDLSNVEAAFKTIDISYREQFLPDTRDFFTHQAEYYGDRAIFHSGRVGDFDVGAKLTGTHGEYRVGMLDAWNAQTSRNDFVSHVSRQVGQYSDVSLSLVDVREPGFDNTTVSGGFNTRFKEDSKFRMDGGYAQSFSSDPLREGHGATVGAGYSAGPGSLGTHWGYSEVSPHFDPIDGYNPRMGFREWRGNIWKEWVPKEGTKFYSSFELFSNFNRGWTWDGDFYSRSLNTGCVIGFKDRHRLYFVRNHSRHLEEHIRPEPFDDTSYNVNARFGRGEDLSGSAYYRWGTVEDSHLSQYGTSLNWQRSSSLQVSLNFNEREQRFFDGTRGSARTIEVGATKILNPEQWLSFRWYARSGDDDISNLNLVYRIHKESGKEFFVILGDPLASEIRERIAVKYIHPISF